MTEATTQEVNRLSEDVRKLAESVDRQAESSNKLSGNLVQTTTVLRQYITEQKGRNERIDGLVDQHTREIGELRRWRAKVDATVPKTLIDGEAIEARFQNNETAINAIKNTIAWWGGGIAVALIVADVLLKIVL